MIGVPVALNFASCFRLRAPACFAWPYRSFEGCTRGHGWQRRDKAQTARKWPQACSDGLGSRVAIAISDPVDDPTIIHTLGDNRLYRGRCFGRRSCPMHYKRTAGLPPAVVRSQVRCWLYCTSSLAWANRGHPDSITGPVTTRHDWLGAFDQHRCTHCHSSSTAADRAAAHGAARPGLKPRM